MKKMLLVFLAVLVNSGLAQASESPPELWSSIKDLDRPKDACAIQSSYALKKLSVENQVENAYGIYGNLKGNRIVVKCIGISEKSSKVLVAVAGRHQDSVELLRNDIVRLIGK